jgi:hypothetical protein
MITQSERRTAIQGSADTARVTLLYATREERLNAYAAATLAAFELEVGNNGSGGALPPKLSEVVQLGRVA